MNEVVLTAIPGQERRIARALKRNIGLRVKFTGPTGKGIKGKFILSDEQMSVIQSIGKFEIEFTADQVSKNIAMRGAFLSLLKLMPQLTGNVDVRRGFKYLQTSSGKFKIQTMGKGLNVWMYKGSDFPSTEPGLYTKAKRSKSMKKTTTNHKVIKTLFQG